MPQAYVKPQARTRLLCLKDLPSAVARQLMKHQWMERCGKSMKKRWLTRSTPGQPAFMSSVSPYLAAGGLGLTASAVPWMKALIFVTSSAVMRPVKSGMPLSM